MKVYQSLAMMLGARENCIQHKNSEWENTWTERVEALVDVDMPSGSGWDCGTRIDLDASTAEKIVLYGSYHHMDDGGGYDGWTEHRITVTPSLQSGFILRITGQNRNDIKDYLGEMFQGCLAEDISQK